MANVRDFGATGNGKDDDSASFEHALQDGDGTLEIPPGTYLLTRSIVIDLSHAKRVAIIGAGGTAKILMNAAGPAFDFRGTHDKSAGSTQFQA